MSHFTEEELAILLSIDRQEPRPSFTQLLEENPHLRNGLLAHFAAAEGADGAGCAGQ